MTDSSKCPRCGSVLPANFPPGVCPACLLQQGLSPSTFISGVGSAGGSGSRSRHGWTPPTPAELAPRFPQLEIVQLLGQGGMGAVYKVRQRDLDRWAALKVLPDDVAHDPNFSERFQREARALALLGHQHIVIVYEFGQRDGVFFLLMEFVDGVNLRQAIRAGQITAKDALGIVTQICDALQFAHEEGVVHRDIKPENILIDKRGRVKIADFGLAKLLGRSVEVATLTGTHQVMGTPIYMAPEQMEGKRGVDHRADIFSLGVVFYELLTGELPLGRFAPPSQKYSLDVRLDEVVLRTLEKEPDRRYQQASDVKGDVETIRTQPSIAPASKAAKPRRRILKMAFAVAAVVILVLGVEAIRARSSMQYVVVDTNGRPPQYYYNPYSPQSLQNPQIAILSAADAASSASAPAAPSPDPNEANAFVQFTADSVKLNPNFGQSVLSAEHRVLVNQILTRIHKEYLALESEHYTDYEVKDNGTQITTVLPSRRAASDPGQPVGPTRRFADDIARLENELWTQIDSQVPFEQQKFLREQLPLFADEQRAPALVWDGAAGAMGASMGGGAAGSMGMMSPGAAPSMGPMGGSNYPGDWRSNLRYEQLLGWRQGRLPIRISIVRQGKWFRWMIDISDNPSGTPGSPTEPVFDRRIDTGDDPQLPSGLRRFWRNETVAEPKSQSRQDSKVPVISDNSGQGDPFSPSGLPFDVERSEPPRIPSKQLVDDDRFESDDRDPIPLAGGREATSAINDPPTRILPGPADPFAAEVVEPPKSLGEYLREIDQLPAGEQTHWNEVEQRLAELLKRFPGPADKGRIHCRAISLYGQGGIRDHAADVTRHAKEALKYERDPVQRTWMYMYLGNAAELHDNNPEKFVESRSEATRWYLKGYRELLPFHLPLEAPILPNFEKVDEEPPFDQDGDVDPEMTSVEVQRAAQMTIREAALATRELVQKRDDYVSRLKVLFGPLHDVYDKNADAEVRLRAIATRVLPDPKAIDVLVAKVFRGASDFK